METSMNQSEMTQDTMKSAYERIDTLKTDPKMTDSVIIDLLHMKIDTMKAGLKPIGSMKVDLKPIGMMKDIMKIDLNPIDMMIDIMKLDLKTKGTIDSMKIVVQLKDMTQD
uniref:Uncharacterized protein n=1 Tax=Cacopsylla melanoneura TaxID=428564 RepID=A0A8D8QNF2_9HEMI